MSTQKDNLEMNKPNSATKTTSPSVLAWRDALNKSTLTNQEKIEATKVLIKLRQIQERNKALFDSLGLDHSGNPLNKLETEN